MGTAIQLPKEPDATQHEDFIAAVLIALGYFVESNVVYREGTTEILEIDTIATPSGPKFLDRMLFEAKTGSWSFGDLFKLYGWRSYLGIDQARVVYRRECSGQSSGAFSKVSSETDVTCLKFDQTDDTDILAPNVSQVEGALLTTVIYSAWYGFIARRICQQQMITRCRSLPKCEVHKAGKTYHAQIQDAVFGKTPINRIHMLYDAYRESPKLAGSFVDQIVAKEGKTSLKVWDRLSDTHDRPWLQYVMMMEHTARLRIIKNAVEHILREESKASGQRVTQPKPGRIDWTDALLAIAPSSFKTAINKLQPHKHRRRIPYLLQVFIEVFGGFYSLRDDEDLADLATLSGIPKDEVEECLGFYDHFFPFQTGWFQRSKDELCRLKFVPGVYHGVGAIYRTRRRELKGYSTYMPSMAWLVRDWHNALYRCLEPSLGVEDDEDD